MIAQLLQLATTTTTLALRRAYERASIIFNVRPTIDIFKEKTCFSEAELIKIWEQRVHHLVPMELVSDSHTHTTTTATTM